MILLKIVEKCEIENKKEKSNLRKYIYESNKDIFEDAVADFIFNFDADKIIDSEDEFESACLGSEVISISKYEK